MTSQDPLSQAGALHRSIDETRAWLRGLLQAYSLTPTDLARKAGLSSTTLTRVLNDPDHPHDISDRTRRRIMEALGLLPTPPVTVLPPPLSGFREPDAVEYTPQGEDVTDIFLRQLQKLRPHLTPWRLKTRILEPAGYLPGDLLLVDLNETARSSDIVCAQIYDWSRNRAETVFRVFQPPYLLAPGERGQPLKPLVVDDESIAVKGVVVDMIRGRAAIN